MGVALSCTLYNHFLVKGTAPAKKKPICAKMKIILKPILSYACLLKMWEKFGSGFRLRCILPRLRSYRT